MTALIALEDAYYRGQRIRCGQEFTFDGDKPPKWAAPKGSKAVLALSKPVDPCLKPKGINDAAARRAEWWESQRTIVGGIFR